MWLTNFFLWIGYSNVSTVYLGTIMLATTCKLQKKCFLAHLRYFKVIWLEDSTFIHSCTKWGGCFCYFLFANINFKTHAVSLTDLLSHSVVSWNSRQRSSKAGANIGTGVFSRNPYVCTRIFEKQECLRSLSIQSVFVN